MLLGMMIVSHSARRATALVDRGCTFFRQKMGKKAYGHGVSVLYQELANHTHAKNREHLKSRPLFENSGLRLSSIHLKSSMK